jgi:hypothetical protein
MSNFSATISEPKGWETVTILPLWRRIQSYSGDWFHIRQVNDHYECDISLSPHDPRSDPDKPAPFIAPTENELLLKVRTFVQEVEVANAHGKRVTMAPAKELRTDSLTDFFTGQADLSKAANNVGEWEYLKPWWKRLRANDHYLHVFKESGKWHCRVSKNSDDRHSGRIVARNCATELECGEVVRDTIQATGMEVRAMADRDTQTKREQLDNMEQQAAALTEFIAWMKQHRAPPQPALSLQPATASHYHKMRDNIVTRVGDDMRSNPLLDEMQVFVLEHNWAAAFRDNAQVNTGSYAEADFHLPFPNCAFEFRISGKNIIVICTEDDALPGPGMILKPFIETKAGWWTDSDYTYILRDGNPKPWSIKSMMQEYPELRFEGVRDWDGVDRYAPIMMLCFPQIKASCIAMEAEVAYHDVQRQDAALVKARIKSGKRPPKDFHIVRLTKTTRAQPMPRTADGHEPRWRVRLHFRRGHWRHYENHRTWIKWMLVGNADLGFIDKEYRL